MVRIRSVTAAVIVSVLFVGLLPLAAHAVNGVCLGRKVTVEGSPGIDNLLTGSTGNDVIASFDGDDVVRGAGGDDRVCGGAGDDVVYGDSGNDVIRGNAGNDVLVGGDGGDGYNGGPGTDICDVQAGDRVFDGCEASLEDDSDDDGLLNGAELELDTDWLAGDTDGDGDLDGDEVDAGTDPLEPEVDVPNPDSDTDADGVRDAVDNCRELANRDQANLDGDAFGNACDPDDDGDRIDDADDRCPLVLGYHGCPPVDVPAPPAPPAPLDGDADGVLDAVDNCISTANAAQTDSDQDGTGDACQDDDLDGIFNDVDNCLSTPNAGQADADVDGTGDACELPEPPTGLPTFQEFYLEVMVPEFGPCDMGPMICEMAVFMAYMETFGQAPPPYVLPPGFFGAFEPVIICPPMMCMGGF